MEAPLTAVVDPPKRLVTLQRDDIDFVMSFHPEDVVVFRHSEPYSLRKVCAGLRWKIINDGSNAKRYGDRRILRVEMRGVA
jgi:hypothetical protein